MTRYIPIYIIATSLALSGCTALNTAKTKVGDYYNTYVEPYRTDCVKEKCGPGSDNDFFKGD